MVPVLFFVAVFLAEVIGTTAGFGASTLLMPVALFFFDFRTSLVLVAFVHAMGGLSRIVLFRQGIDSHLLLAFGLPSVVFALFGALLVNYAPQELLVLVLGAFLVGYAGIGWKGVRIRESVQNKVVGGSLSGFFAGLIGTGGALRSAFLSAFGLEKSAYIATAAVVSLAVDVTRIPVYVGSGFLPADLWIVVPVIAVIAVVGSWCGSRVVRLLPADVFRKWVLVAIALAGVKFVYDGVAYFL